MAFAGPTSERAHYRKRRIVLTTMGSLGDLQPYIAIALGLKGRGHEASLATGECYRQKIEALGLGFRAVRPDCDWVNDPVVMRRFMAPLSGLIRFGRDLALPALRESYEDTLAAVEGADLLVSQLPFAARLVAEKTGIAWASSVHIPLFFFSAHDPSVLPLAPVLSKVLRRLGPSFWSPFFWLSKRATRSLARPWYHFRAQLKLRATAEGNPLVDSHSPTLVLALFSQALADKQPDWPAQTVITGFPIQDVDSEPELPHALAQFLDAGPPPLVFTLGTAVAVAAGRFFEVSAAAAARMGRRAVLIVHHLRNRPKRFRPDLAAFEYAPFSQLFPRAAAIVHHGGIGTTGLGMRSGRPMLVVPHAWDQPDNAERVTRLGIARTISPRRYTAERAAAELRRLLDDASYARQASEIGQRVRQEDGVQVACDALERLLEREHPRIHSA